jgi:hypothetical protein
MRAVPELVTIFKGMFAATRSVSTMLILLILCMYIFAIIFKVQVGDHEELGEFFGTIPMGMWTLFLQGTLLDDITSVLNLILETSPAMTVFFLIFVIIASFMTMNMLIGILCEVISAVAETENEAMVVNYVKQQLLDILDGIDFDGNRMISKTEFLQLLKQEEFRVALETLDVDCRHIASLSDTLFESDGLDVPDEGAKPGSLPASPKEALSKQKTLSYAEFLEMLLGLRASKQVSVTHMFDLRKFIRFQNRVTMHHVDDVEATVDQVVQRQAVLEAKLDNMQKTINQDMQEMKHTLSKLMQHTMGKRSKSSQALTEA